MENQTAINHFLLLGFTEIFWIKILLFLLLLIVYLLTLLGNMTIILVMVLNGHLHTPMYFFLRNFSIVEMGFISIAIPNMLFQLLSRQKTISSVACFTQVFFAYFLGIMEFCLLAVMAVDRYVAICHPFRYSIIMHHKLCVQLVVSCWLVSFLCSLTPILFLTRLPFCGPNTIDHFMCDSAPLIHLACSDTQFVDLLYLVIAIIVLLGTLVIVVASYIKIISAVLHLPSAKERNRTFSTCSSHFLVVTLLYGSCIFVYIQPEQQRRLELNKEVSILNMLVSPLLNPFIYSFRNKGMQEALRVTGGRWLSKWRISSWSFHYEH
ncbi:olfactory receptor 6C4-like [Eublepharis macularius]|uniref:Olfactory receptor n=1 Tax=Eublepharis macularius TaxID=481883 RepID=A0AA97LC66_EUBMA|nr:olfactory receptor 6C4-like [Eublepharis macularius]